jgi:hypothetical protein
VLPLLPGDELSPSELELFPEEFPLPEDEPSLLFDEFPSLLEELPEVLDGELPAVVDGELLTMVDDDLLAVVVVVLLALLDEELCSLDWSWFEPPLLSEELPPLPLPLPLLPLPLPDEEDCPLPFWRELRRLFQKFPMLWRMAFTCSLRSSSLEAVTESISGEAQSSHRATLPELTSVKVDSREAATAVAPGMLWNVEVVAWEPKVLTNLEAGSSSCASSNSIEDALLSPAYTCEAATADTHALARRRVLVTNAVFIWWQDEKRSQCNTPNRGPKEIQKSEGKLQSKETYIEIYPTDGTMKNHNYVVIKGLGIVFCGKRWYSQILKPLSDALKLFSVHASLTDGRRN